MRTEIVILIILIALAALLTIVASVWIAARRASSQKLRERFGPEYDYTIDKVGDQRTAEEILKDREKRFANLEILDLDENRRDQYHKEWIEIQAGFVDDPSKSVAEANRLITEVMISRGFPVADFEQRAADLSVLYPDLVSNYRDANAIVLKNQRYESSTEDLRQAMVYFHSLFEELLGIVGDHEVEAEQKEYVSK